MPNQGKPVLTGEPLNPSIEWVLNIAMELIQHNSGSLDTAVTDVLSAITRLNEAAAEQGLQQVSDETNRHYQAVCARLTKL